MSDRLSLAPSDFPTPAEFRDELTRRCRRGLRIGAVVGVALVVLLVGLSVVLFSISGPRPGRSAWAFVPTAVQLGMLIVVAAGLGRMQASLWATQLLREAAGERTVAARVRKVVFKGQAPLNEDEQARAVTWAPLAAVYLRHQAVSDRGGGGAAGTGRPAAPIHAHLPPRGLIV